MALNPAASSPISAVPRRLDPGRQVSPAQPADRSREPVDGGHHATAQPDGQTGDHHCGQQHTHRAEDESQLSRAPGGTALLLAEQLLLAVECVELLAQRADADPAAAGGYLAPGRRKVGPGSYRRSGAVQMRT